MSDISARSTIRSAPPGSPKHLQPLNRALQVVVRLDIHHTGRIDDIGGLCALCDIGDTGGIDDIGGLCALCEIGGVGNIAPSRGECLLHRRGVSHIKSNNGAAKSPPAAGDWLEYLRCCRHERSLLISGEPDHSRRAFNGGEALSPSTKIRIPQAVQFFGSGQGQCHAAKIVSRHEATLSSTDWLVITTIATTWLSSTRRA